MDKPLNAYGLSSASPTIDDESEASETPHPNPHTQLSPVIVDAFDADDSSSDSALENGSCDQNPPSPTHGSPRSPSRHSPGAKSGSSPTSSPRRPRSPLGNATRNEHDRPSSLGHLQVVGLRSQRQLEVENELNSPEAVVESDIPYGEDACGSSGDYFGRMSFSRSRRPTSSRAGSARYAMLDSGGIDIDESSDEGTSEADGGLDFESDGGSSATGRQDGNCTGPESSPSASGEISSDQRKLAQAKSSSSAVSKLKKGWRAMKKSTEKSTANAVKSTASASRKVSSISALYRKSTSSSTFNPGLPMTPEERTAWEERQTADCDEWLNSILPAWKKKRGSARTRSLAFRGIPPGVRGRVWLIALGNPLNITPELFSVLKERAYDGRMDFLRSKETLDKADGDVGGYGGRAEPMLKEERSAHKAIMLDLPRTFPELSFFHADGSEYEDSLREVLEAFMYLRPDIGYSQGMSFLAAVLLLYVDDVADVFACFANMLLHESCFLHFFSMKMPEVRIYLSVHDRFLRDEMPTLSAHFKQHNVEADLYMINWVMSLYCGALPLDIVSRIWDVYMLDGDVAIFRAALGILKLLQPKLLGMHFEEMAFLLSHLPEEIEQDALLRCIRGVRSVTRPRLKELFRSCESREARASAEDPGAMAKAVAAASSSSIEATVRTAGTSADIREMVEQNLPMPYVTDPPTVNTIEYAAPPRLAAVRSGPSPPPLPRSPSPL